MKKSDFNYDLPGHLIAQHPSAERDGCRLLCLNGETGALADCAFTDLPDFLEAGDCLVLNDTRVLPARLLGVKAGGTTPVEMLLLERRTADEWEVICRPGRRLKAGVKVVFIPGVLEADVLEVLPGGNRRVRFLFDGIWETVLDQAGVMPLPPYIHEQLDDPERYQTVYAVHNGSSAAPTAGLHFTEKMLTELSAAGIDLAYVTLHIGLGTFRPVKADNILDHQMHREYYILNERACGQINRARAGGHRVICVGTTACRVVESAAEPGGVLRPKSGYTDIFIYPGYTFKVMDALITNFHLPESTLIMLVSAFAGYSQTMAAYRHAVSAGYRFFSFGDAMFLTRVPRPDLPPDDAAAGRKATDCRTDKQTVEQIKRVNQDD